MIALLILAIVANPTITPKRLELTRAYCRRHYGLGSEQLVDPKIVVIHATELATFAESLKAFQPDTLPAERGELKPGGELNVGIHYLVDRDGTVHSLIPLDVIARHVIGLNHVSIGIENVGFADKLTPAQLEADAALVQELLKERPSLRYLIGHHEYNDKKLPHHVLFKELDSKYRPTVKSDPGKGFMRELRAKLAASGVRLED